jgi:hypothetical protein
VKRRDREETEKRQGRERTEKRENRKEREQKRAWFVATSMPVSICVICVICG